MDKIEINAKSNSLKAKSGSDLDKIILSNLTALKDDGVIADFKSKVSFQHPGYSYKKQYLANFIVETHEGQFIVIRRANSIRSDRAKTGFYDLDGILRYSNFSDKIIATVYLVPDSEKDQKDFKNIRNGIKAKEYYSPATHILTLTEFGEFLDGFKNSVLTEIEDDSVLLETEKFHKDDNLKIVSESIPVYNKVLMTKEEGKRIAMLGIKYETEVTLELNNPQNLEKLRAGADVDNFEYNLILTKIALKHNFKVTEISLIEASSNIPLLLFKGHAKTDIKIIIQLDNRTKITETISLKHSNANQVSCHDYKVKDFIRVLKCEGEKLADYLTEFQKQYNYSNFEKSINEMEGYTIEEFTKLLSDKKDIFNWWVLTGKHDDENIIDPETQISNFILIKKRNKEENTNKIFFYSMDEYINMLMLQSKLKYGVPFTWTRPSGSEGKRIQLKVPLLEN